MEEEQYRDILLLLELLTNLLSKDFIDLSPLDNQEPEDNMTAADVCLYGLNIIMPVKEMLFTLFFIYIYFVFKGQSHEINMLFKPQDSRISTYFLCLSWWFQMMEQLVALLWKFKLFVICLFLITGELWNMTTEAVIIYFFDIDGGQFFSLVYPSLDTGKKL